MNAHSLITAANPAFAGDKTSSTGVSRCLKAAVIAALSSAIAAISMRLLPTLLVFDPIFLLATLVGVICSPISLIKERGFSRLVAALSLAVSICALFECISFFRWALKLP